MIDGRAVLLLIPALRSLPEEQSAENVDCTRADQQRLCQPRPRSGRRRKLEIDDGERTLGGGDHLERRRHRFGRTVQRTQVSFTYLAITPSAQKEHERGSGGQSGRTARHAISRNSQTRCTRAIITCGAWAYAYISPISIDKDIGAGRTSPRALSRRQRVPPLSPPSDRRPSFFSSLKTQPRPLHTRRTDSTYRHHQLPPASGRV